MDPIWRFQTRPANRNDARKVSLILVCQPSPLARRAASTSASKRSLTGSLGATALGRPRALSLVPSYRSAVLKNSDVNSGASPGSFQIAGVERFFAVLCFPHSQPSCPGPCNGCHQRPLPHGRSPSHATAAFSSVLLGRTQDSWDTARQQAGLADVRIHDLRHSFASFLVNAGRSLYEVQKILGHTQIKTTQRYAHLSQDTLIDAANVVPFTMALPMVAMVNAGSSGLALGLC
jgi:hypothetical protein